MNANTALLSTRRCRHLLMPALLGVCTTGCSLVFDADELAESYETDVEIIASRQCNPSRVLVADGHVYWTTSYVDSNNDEVCEGPESTAIRRLAFGSTGEPQDIATKNLDGTTGMTRPWGFTVAGEDLYWVNDADQVCTAEVDGVKQACSTPDELPMPCRSFGIASAKDRVYFHTGDCKGGTGTEIRSYATKTQVSSDLNVAVEGTFVLWIGVVPVGSSEDDAWLAWIDKCPDKDNNRMNVVRLSNTTSKWSRCTNSKGVFSGAIDINGLYWPDEAKGTVDMLPLPDGVLMNAEPTTLVTGLTRPGGVALDAKHVYVTNEGLDGSVLHVPRSASPPMLPLDAGEIGLVASGRKDAHGGKGVPYRITAEDEAWLYWVVNEGGHAVERARKPD
jgi:hypothetical protein